MWRVIKANSSFYIIKLATCKVWLGFGVRATTDPTHCEVQFNNHEIQKQIRRGTINVLSFVFFFLAWTTSRRRPNWKRKKKSENETKQNWCEMFSRRLIVFGIRPKNTNFHFNCPQINLFGTVELWLWLGSPSDCRQTTQKAGTGGRDREKSRLN